MDFKVSIESLERSLVQILFSLAKIRSAGDDVQGNRVHIRLWLQTLQLGCALSPCA